MRHDCETQRTDIKGENNFRFASVIKFYLAYVQPVACRQIYDNGIYGSVTRIRFTPICARETIALLTAISFYSIITKLFSALSVRLCNVCFYLVQLHDDNDEDYNTEYNNNHYYYKQYEYISDTCFNCR